MRNAYLSLLLRLLFLRVCDSQTITLMFGGGSYASQLRTQAERNGHIKKRIITVRERTRHSVTLYSLTKKGYAYLLEKEEKIGSLLFFNLTGPKTMLLKRSDFKEERQLKIARDSAALIFAERTGAAITCNNFSASLQDGTGDPIDDDSTSDESTSFETHFRDFLFDGNYSEIKLFANTSIESTDMVYHNSTVIKTEAGHANSYVTARDFLAGRYSGIIDSPYRSMMIYVAPMFGMRWQTWLTQKEIGAYTVWGKMHALASNAQRNKTGSCAALIVNNPRQFSNLYLNLDRAKREKEDFFGGPFDHFYILPFTSTGVHHLKWLMHIDDDDFRKTIIRSSIKSGRLKQYEGPAPGSFPLVDEKGIRTAVGLELDAKKMLLIQGTADRFPGNKFAVICAPWQVPYYEAVMPENVEIIPVEVNGFY